MPFTRSKFLVLSILSAFFISLFGLAPAQAVSPQPGTTQAKKTTVTKWKSVPQKKVLGKGKGTTLKAKKTYTKKLSNHKKVPSKRKSLQVAVKVSNAKSPGSIIVWKDGTKKSGKVRVRYGKGTTVKTVNITPSKTNRVKIKSSKTVKVRMYTKGYSYTKKVNGQSPLKHPVAPKPPVNPAPKPIVKPTPAPTPAPSPEPKPYAPNTKPGSHNTGVPAGTKLTVLNKGLTITKDGTVVDGMDIRGFVRVKANNVTIKNSIIRGLNNSDYNMHLVQNSTGGKNLKIVDSTLASMYPSPYVNGIVGMDFSLKRVDIYNVVDQVSIIGDNVTIEDSWLHGNLHYVNDPNWNGKPSHDDNIQISIGKNLRFTNNVLESTKSAAVMLTQDRGQVSNAVFTKNWLNGGSCTVNISEKRFGAPQGLVFNDNIFGVDTRINHCAIIKPLTTPVAISGNTFVDGAPFKFTRGA